MADTTGLTALEIQNLIMDPTKAIALVLDKMNSDSNGVLSFQDPTHPAVNILEASAFLSSAVWGKMNANLRDVFPAIAVDNENLYKHISDADILGISSSPATISVVFNIKKIDLEQMGVKYSGFKKCAIPLYTNIKIDNIDFTILNRINILLYDNGKIDIEQDISPNGLGIDSMFYLENFIIQQDDSDWILFETLIKQTKRELFKESIVAGKRFVKTIDIADKFYFTEVTAVNSDNSRVKLDIVYNDKIFNKNTPSIYVKFLENQIVYELPMIYQANGIINSSIEIVLYTTKGEIVIPTEILENNQFSISLGETIDSESSVTEQINKFCLSRGMATYGNNGKSIEEIKKSVIYNTIGKIDIPITTAEFKDAALREGFYLELIRDTVTERNFVVTKNLPISSNSAIKTKADIFNNQVSIVLDEKENYDNISIVNDDIVLKANSLFKYKNGIVTMLTNLEVFNLTNMSKKNLVAYLNENEVFYNPYTYIIAKDSSIINSRVYNLNSPKLLNLRVLNKNNYVTPRVNITAMDISLQKYGYLIRFKISGNDTFNTLRPEFVKAQISMSLNTSLDLIYFTSSMTVDGAGNKFFLFQIESNLLVDSTNGLNITNGQSAITTKTVPISGQLNINIYSIDNQVVKDVEHSNLDDNILIDDKEFLNVFVVEELDYVFGQELSYLWNDVKNYYTNKKFKKHTSDAFARYQENVYDLCEETGTIFWPVRNVDEDIIDYETRLAFAKGDIIEDDLGNRVYAYRAGDYVLDANGNMILDGISGVVRAIDILMVDYKFKVAEIDYPAYVSEYTNTIINWLNNAITALNKNSLDQTIVQFKSDKNTGTVKLISNNITTTHESIISPKIVLYLSDSISINLNTTKTFKDTIGRIIHNYIETRSFTMNDIRASIIKELGTNVMGVKITGITNDDREIVNIEENSNVFTLSKDLFIDNDNNIDITYKITLEIESNI